MVRANLSPCLLTAASFFSFATFTPPFGLGGAWYKVDLFLIHTPLAGPEHRVGQYRALLECQKLGLAKSVGVSNYGIKHLQVVARTVLLSRLLRLFQSSEEELVVQPFTPRRCAGSSVRRSPRRVTPSSLQWHFYI